MVAIEAKFISAYDDFLQDVGIDIRGANVGADFNDGTTVTRPGYYATRGMANNSSNWDLRVQTFQTWLNAQGVGELSTFSPGSSITPVLAPTHPSGAGLSGQGGLGLQYQMLGNQALQLVLKALHKDERVTLIQQPNITTFSGQRSNITVLRQIAYIQDVEVQTGALLGGYDPIVNILNVGAVLDVRPIVSNDKKYVKMDLRLYQLSLNAFTTYDVFNAGLNIQLPNINYQQAETTVQMADRGTILISGFKNITNRDLEAKTPFLGEIPILSFFFSRKVKENEHQNELILVTPRIIDLGEEEEKLK
ncbi:MAG: hypothetical protein A2W23_06840 [Planctomycetes bacterium RBG_16_43_13]|nr:MAG: hypothetical protein A2W23_06840 [Planctomycetes bacterium RBG_16_43_13]